MVEKVGDGYSIGHLRIKYLDLANISFAQNNYPLCHGYIKDFLDTVEENGEAGHLIKDEFDRVMRYKKEQIESLGKQVQDLGYLERKDVENQARDQIEVNALHDMKEICWRISLEKGLFYD